MSNRLSVSFEFFPPNDDAMARQLWEAVCRLAPLQPDFVSVTYGADGSTRARTHECVSRILRETSLSVAPHLTCIGATRREIHDIAADYCRQGVRRIVALRGDLPADVATAVDDGYAYASDLVRGLKASTDLQISVAAYPEGHPETGTVAADLENLRRKVDAGATQAITQFFFDTDVFLRYRDSCRAAGMHLEIVPGILPITRLPQLLRFAGRCGATVPGWLRERFEGLEDDADTRRMIAAHVALDQVERLRAEGVDAFHFYTLNRAELTYAICHALGLRPPQVAQAQVAQAQAQVA